MATDNEINKINEQLSVFIQAELERRLKEICIQLTSEKIFSTLENLQKENAKLKLKLQAEIPVLDELNKEVPYLRNQLEKIKEEVHRSIHQLEKLSLTEHGEGQLAAWIEMQFLLKGIENKND